MLACPGTTFVRVARKISKCSRLIGKRYIDGASHIVDKPGFNGVPVDSRQLIYERNGQLGRGRVAVATDDPPEHKLLISTTECLHTVPNLLKGEPTFREMLNAFIASRAFSHEIRWRRTGAVLVRIYMAECKPRR
jgi:hypothetical protein